MLLFCVASNTDWKYTAIPGEIVTTIVVRGPHRARRRRASRTHGPRAGRVAHDAAGLMTVESRCWPNLAVRPDARRRAVVGAQAGRLGSSRSRLIRARRMRRTAPMRSSHAPSTSSSGRLPLRQRSAFTTLNGQFSVGMGASSPRRRNFREFGLCILRPLWKMAGGLASVPRIHPAGAGRNRPAPRRPFRTNGEQS
jgi:hypothetical protein